MNYRMISNIIGKVLCVEAVFMLPALIISACCGEGKAVIGFAVTIAVLLVIGLPLALRKPKRTDVFAKEGLAAAGLVWLAVSILGALPFLLSGAIPNYIDCLFETVSGFTTTGATILGDVESLPLGILYWRSFTHWLGGMGVLVFLLILNPLTAKNSGENMYLLRAESPGIRITKLVPRMKDSAAILYMIYIVLTVLEFLFLVIGRVPVFDSVTIALGTAGTGGFAIRNDSLASYSTYAQWVVSAFMFLFSVNFSLYFLLLMRRVKPVVRNEELRCFLCLIIVSVAVIMINTQNYYGSFEENLRTAVFQVLSILSTSGFCTTDFDLWPQLSRTLMVLLMFCGACAGSTGGGAKVIRIQLLFKSARRAVYRAVHPNAVRLIRQDGEVMDDDTVNSLGVYFLIYFAVIAAGTLLLSVDGFSLETNLTASISCMNNIGPGMDAVGAVMNYGGFSWFSKLVLSVIMLIGRLEIFPILALFCPTVWKK